MYQITNAYEDGREIVTLARDAGGKLTTRRHAAAYIAWLSKSDGERVIDTLRRRPTVKQLVWQGEWLRVGFTDRYAREAACNPDTQHGPGWLTVMGVTPLESDLSALKVWLAESDIEFLQPRRVYLDIEVDPRNHTFDEQTEGAARVLAWSIAREGELIQEILEADTDEAERELLRSFWREIEQDDQVAAWNGDGYDFPVLFNRTVRLGMQCDPRRWIWLDHLPIFKRYNMSASESGDEKQSMALHAVAMAVLGYGKDDFDAMQSFEAWQQGEGGVEFERFAAYNAKDTALMLAIELATGYLGIHQEVCAICNVISDTRGSNPTNFAEGWLIRQGRAEGIRYPSKWYSQERDCFAGAYVMEPTKTGILRNVHVADFVSMYPSIIVSWNMSAETFLCHTEDREPPAGCSLAPGMNALFSTKKLGALPMALLKMQQMRARHSEAKAAASPGSEEWTQADRRATSCKMLINSVYGIVGAPSSRFYKREVVEACTQAGVWLIKKTIGEVEVNGYEPIYSDTDSVYVQGCGEDAFRRFVARLNDVVYPALTASLGLRQMQVKIEYEKEFSVLVMVGKKRYAGLFAHYKGKRSTGGAKAEVKGLEVKRGDTAKLARQLQQRAIDMLLTGTTTLSDATKFIDLEREHIMSAALSLSDVKITKTVNHPLRDYKGAKLANGADGLLPQHIRAAKALVAAGVTVRQGTRVGYVVVDGPKSLVVPEQHYTGEFDRHYLWENLVYPPTQRLLDACFPASARLWAGYGKTRKHDLPDQRRLF